MSITTLEGFIKDGQVQLATEAALPEGQVVYVVVPGASPHIPRVQSPRLADPRQISGFTIEMGELP